MAQISAGTAVVINGTNLVSFAGADISAVAIGHAFHIPGIDAVYSIIAVFPGVSPPTVALSVPYAGATNTLAKYVINRLVPLASSFSMMHWSVNIRTSCL